MRSRIRSQKGIALPLVLLFVIVLILLGFGLSIFGYYEATSAIREEHLAKAFYIARGSVAALVDFLTKIPGDVTENNLEVYQEDVADFVDSVIANGLKGFYEVGGTNTAEGLANFSITAKSFKDTSTKTGRLELTSVGTSGKFSRDASIQLKYTLQEYRPFGLVDCALFTKTTANNTDGKDYDYGKYKVDAYGKVIASKDPDDPNIVAQIAHDLHIDVAEGFKNYDYQDTFFIIPEQRNYRIPRELEFPGLIIEKGNVLIDTPTIWTENSTDKTTTTVYRVNNLTINGGGSLKFNKAGIVVIIVDGTLTLRGDIGCNPECLLSTKPALHKIPECWYGRVNIVYNGTSDIVIGGNAYVRANIISLRAGINMDITTIGTPVMSGHIIAGTEGNIIFRGDFEGNSLIYAPNATVQVGGSSGLFFGSIICESFVPNAHINLNYVPIPRSSLPIWYGANATGFLDDDVNLGTGEYYITNLVSDRWL